MDQAKSFMGNDSSSNQGSSNENVKQDKIEEKAKSEGFGDKAKDFATDQVVNSSTYLLSFARVSGEEMKMEGD